jgi:hypothetical protein
MNANFNFLYQKLLFSVTKFESIFRDLVKIFQVGRLVAHRCYIQIGQYNQMIYVE